MSSNETLGQEAIAATDEFFTRQPVAAEETRESTDETAEGTTASTIPPSSDEAEKPPSILRDYVRELQQEYEEQEKEGKV